jgi:hypothetical protein
MSVGLCFFVCPVTQKSINLITKKGYSGLRLTPGVWDEMSLMCLVNCLECGWKDTWLELHLSVETLVKDVISVVNLSLLMQVLCHRFSSRPLHMVLLASYTVAEHVQCLGLASLSLLWFVSLPPSTEVFCSSNHSNNSDSDTKSASQKSHT